MPILDNEVLLALWLDGELSDEQHALFMQRCAQDPEFAAIVEQANHFTDNTDAFATWTVPQWDRLSAIEGQENWFGRCKRQLLGGGTKIGLLSASISCCAVVIALFALTHQATSPVSTEFTQTISTQETKRLIAEQVAVQVKQEITLQQQNAQALFAQYADALHTQQLATSKQLTEYLLSASRQERKEDFAELVQFINEQRVNDQRFYAQQFNDLQDEIYANNPPPINISQE